MEKEVFNNLSIEEQINTVNALLAQGENLMGIFVHKKLIDAKESTVRSRFVKAGYKLNKSKNQYLKIDSTTEVPLEYPTEKENKKGYLKSTPDRKINEYPSSTLEVLPNESFEDPSTIVTKESEKRNLKEDSQSPSDTIKEQSPNSTLAIVPPEKVQKLIRLVDAQPELEEILDWWKKEKNKNNIIDVPSISFDKNKLQGEITNKTFKTFKGVIDDFLTFCGTYPEYMQRDLVAMALVEYMNRYKK